MFLFSNAQILLVDFNKTLFFGLARLCGIVIAENSDRWVGARRSFIVFERVTKVRVPKAISSERNSCQFSKAARAVERLRHGKA
jgi:hypothetical protein